MSSLTQELASFAVEAKFDNIPEAVVHEAKRILLDSIGCALAGIATDKGKISIKLARRLGASQESSIIGVGDRVSCYSAAFANGELINALDYDAVLSPPTHVSPYVIPAPLALAEAIGASGRELILATVLGHEIATRVAQALKGGAEFIQTEPGRGSCIRLLSGFSQCIFGGAVGAGKILKLDHKEMSHALGIAGHFCPVPTSEKWQETVPSAMTKFGSTGWVSAAEVTAALLAEMGYVGDITVLDGEYGFWRFFGSETWKPNAIMEKIGETWFLLNTKYKPYPCCGILATALDCFVSIIDKNNLLPDEIESVDIFCAPLVEKPLWKSKELATHVDAQFSAPYVFAVAAYRVKIGSDWQDLDSMTNPKILEFMKKVNCHAHPRFEEAARTNPRNSIGMVEVIARGDKFREERMYYKGTPFTDVKATDEELVGKFKRNASGILTRDNIDKAVSSLLRLEDMEDIRELMRQIVI